MKQFPIRFHLSFKKSDDTEEKITNKKSIFYKIQTYGNLYEKYWKLKCNQTGRFRVT